VSVTFMQKCVGLVLQRCPRCAHGRVYARGMKMNPRCPICDLVFEREPGYFLGALYVTYFMATSVMLIGMGLLHLLLPEWDLGYLVPIVGLAFLPFVPLVTRYGRVIWIYFDRWAWPVRAGRSD
jgi:uncharacterized protein (DUF983 family)